MRDARKKIARFFDRHIEHVVDIFAFIRYVERFFVKALSAANVALNVHVGQKIHFNDDSPRSLTIFAPAALYVKAESARAVASRFRFGKRCKEIAYAAEKPDVCRGVRPRRAPDGALIDIDNFVDIRNAFDLFEFADRVFCAHKLIAECGIEHVGKQRRFAGSRNARYARKSAEGNLYGNVFQIVLGRSRKFDTAPVAAPPFCRNRHAQFSREVLPRNAFGDARNLFGRSRRNDAASVHARRRPQVDEVVRGSKRLFVVFDDDNRIARVAEVGQRVDQFLIVPLVQPDRRFVEDIHNADEGASDLRGKPDPLRFASRQRFRRTLKREVIESDVFQKAQARAYLF